MAPNNNYRKFIPFPKDRALLYKASGYWVGQTHTDFIQEACIRYPNNIAIIQDDLSITYKDFYEKVVKYGSYLKWKGIKKEDFIILQSPNTAAFFVALFGIYYAGARPIFALDGHGAHEIENIAKSSGAIGYIRIIKNRSIKDDVTSIIDKFIERNVHLLYQQTIYSDDNIDFMVPVSEFNSIISPESVDSESIAFLQLSGGTTGMPKLIPRTHDDYLYSVRESAKVAQLHPLSKQLIVLPISHNFTMSSPGFLGALYSGATIVLAENGSPDTCFPLIAHHKISQISLVPSLAILWLNSSLLESYDLSSLEVIQVGGSELLPKIAERLINTLNIKLQQVYGMAEGLVNFTHLNDDLNTIINTQGKKLSPSDEILIVDNDGNKLPTNSIGNIITRGPYTINGYYNASEINLLSFTKEGFYITGDIGYLDEDLNIVVTGRAKNQINRAGEKISPSELENLIISHPLVKDVSVVGVKDDLLGEKIKVKLISLDKNSAISLSDIRTFLLSKNVAEYKLPDEIELVTSFPHTLIGKVKR
ncbi:AMP-binding protein [Brenneria sp. g21c3]|uniref:(2,3-dihydroxybenzoyl)adenylate synthase n=1 Tax=Brenneria sp. g21c3 TaxID=3093893 RepID=UPI002EA20798|nr:AMP-binding protein [Brenneria sp. g21c3]